MSADLNAWFRKIGTALSDGDYEAGIAALAAHDAQVEAAVREQITADIEAVLPPSVVTTGPAAYVAGMRDGLHDAARIARGGTR